MDSSLDRPSRSITEERIPAEINRLQLDLLASRACAALRAAGLPHTLIKGPTTSLWLYDPPRPYTDVDLLVPPSRIPEAVALLAREGIARPTAGRFGEIAAHSQVLLTDRGFEVDLHGTLPTLTVNRRDPDKVWHVLAQRTEAFELSPDWELVPALTAQARTVVLALHALGGGCNDARGLEDLRRAREALSEEEWQASKDLASELGVAVRFDAMTAVLDGRPIPEVDRETALWLVGAPGARIQLARLGDMPMLQRMQCVKQELLPSRGFLEWSAGTDRKRSLVGAYLARGVRIAASLRGGR